MASPRVWLVTGTSSGFGRRLVNIAHARGDRVIATAKTLASISHFHKGHNERMAHIHCAELDISAGTDRVRKRINDIVKSSGWGGVDVLVNNAGTAVPLFVEEGGSESLRYQFQTNVFGTLDVTLAVLPYMRKQKSGTIVMLGSRSAWRTNIMGLGFYSSSKAALHAISETMAAELEPFGVRVLIVKPGSFRTEGIYRNHLHGGSNPIPDYNGKREEAAEVFMSPAGKQRGDPVKAMKALVEVVCGEGRAQDKPWPLYLVLGKDADQDVRNKCAQMVTYLDEWSDIVRDVDFDDPD